MCVDLALRRIEYIGVSSFPNGKFDFELISFDLEFGIASNG